MNKSESKKLLREQKQRVVNLLKEAGFTSIPKFNVVNKRILGKEDPYKESLGQYVRGHQFTRGLTIIVNVDQIYRSKGIENLEYEVAMTIAHEFGHSLVEVIESHELIDKYKDLDWESVYEGDEEEFVEMFAYGLISGEIHDYVFLDEFTTQIAKCYEELMDN